MSGPPPLRRLRRPARRGPAVPPRGGGPAGPRPSRRWAESASIATVKAQPAREAGTAEAAPTQQTQDGQVQFSGMPSSGRVTEVTGGVDLVCRRRWARPAPPKATPIAAPRSHPPQRLCSYRHDLSQCLLCLQTQSSFHPLRTPLPCGPPRDALLQDTPCLHAANVPSSWTPQLSKGGCGGRTAHRRKRCKQNG